jgi:phosphohistidine phosphatase
MELFLIRHAIAVPRGGDALDHARPLTAKGRTRFEQEVRGIQALGIELDRVYHSPWVRARQTAEILEPLARDLVETQSLATEPTKDLLEGLAGDRIALVGHEPWLGELLALLTAGDASLGSQFRFKKGAVAHCVGVPTPGGAELWAFYPPKALRGLGG